MSLVPGSRLGSYEIVSPLGVGGMGEVYRATDTRLKRQVALKVLPDALATDADRLLRFQREAEVLASLNHPNIAQIYGLEETGGVKALVMELVEGPTLADRIGQGAMPVDEALALAQQIAEAFEAAHEQGIIHRDLKPANIKVRPDGTVKVLDFGLAKALDPGGALRAPAHVPGQDAGRVRSPGFSQSPTITTPAMTQIGMILGTAAYMSPEQAKGKPPDKRSDVWAFGCVLYEMLTGRRAFDGDDISDTLAAVLRAEPDWNALPKDLPAAIRIVIERCLEKDLRRRISGMPALMFALTEAPRLGKGDSQPEPSQIQAQVAEAVAAARRDSQKSLRIRLLAAVAGTAVVVGSVAMWLLRQPPVADARVSRSLISLLPAERLQSGVADELRLGFQRPARNAVALSPDGTTLVFSGVAGIARQLYLRQLDRLEAQPIGGTEGGDSPFFSPDGRSVAFWADGQLKRIAIAGGPAVTICKTPGLVGASWGADDTIVFASRRNEGLWRVPVAGGEPEPFTTLAAGEYSHRLPHFTPDGQAVVFTVLKGAVRWDDAQIVVRSISTGEQKVLIEGGADGRYLPTGHLLFVRLGSLMAAPFDLPSLSTTGSATGLIDDVMQAANVSNFNIDTGAAQLDVSTTGTLAYVRGGTPPLETDEVILVDRRGQQTKALQLPPMSYNTARFAPDGHRLTVGNTVSSRQIWVHDLERGTLSPVTTAETRSSYPIWTLDGKRIVFRSSVGSVDNLFWKTADGAGSAERLAEAARGQTPISWTPDGMTLLFTEDGNAGTESDIWELSLKDRMVRPLLRTAAYEAVPELSPDGRWLAYVSDESGRSQVYVQPYPGPGERIQVSIDGGDDPAWARSGRELFYLRPMDVAGTESEMTAVAVTAAGGLSVSRPQALFQLNAGLAGPSRSYDVAPDGSGFLLIKALPETASPPVREIVLVQNWTQELQRLVPTR